MIPRGSPGVALSLVPLAMVAAVTVAARAQDAAPAGELSPLRIDHAVAASDHVVVGTYEAGRLTVARELKGSLGATKVFVDREDVEVPADLLARGSPRAEGPGVFFLLARFEGRETDRRRFMGWNGPAGTAWIKSATAFAYRSNAEDRFEWTRLGTERGVLDLVAASLAREAALGEAIATAGSAARAGKLFALAKDARTGPEPVERELGHDPFAERALVELAPCGEAAVPHLEALRAPGRPAWLRAAAIRALSSTAEPADVRARRIEKIAQDDKAPEDDVVAAVEALFHLDAASLDVLERLATDARPHVRRSVAAALREKAKDLATLERLMKDEDSSVVETARESARAAARRLGLTDPTGAR